VTARAWARWVGFLGAEEDGISLGLFRVAVALAVLVSLSMLRDPLVLDSLFTDAAYGGMRTLKSPTWPAVLLGGATPSAVRALWSLATLGAVALLLGLGGPVSGRLIALVTQQAYMGLVDLNHHAGGSYDEVLTNLLWILVLAGPTDAVSVPGLLRRRRGLSPRPARRWPRLLVMAQAVLMYGTTGLQKLSAHWIPGGDLMALYYILQQSTWQLGDMRWVAFWVPLTQLGTAVSWWWEVLAPLWLWAWLGELGAGGRVGRALARWHVSAVFMVIGLVFHLGVGLVLEIGPFGEASVALYPAIVQPGAWRGAVAAVRARLEVFHAGARPSEGA
jgi:hypothetical protein